MTAITTTKRFEIRQVLNVETRPTAAPGILAYRCWLVDERDERLHHREETLSWEGLCDEDLPPSRREYRPKPRQRWEAHFKRNLDSVATRGWQNGTPLRAASPTPFTDLTPRRVEQREALGEFAFELVRLDLDSNLLFDVEGLPLVVAQDIEPHLWGTTSEGRYDIDKAVAHLSKHPHVYDVGKRTEWADDGGVFWEFFDFRWAPDLETYRRAWARCLEIERSCLGILKFPRAVFDLDLLGLRAAGCLKSLS